MLKKIAVVVVVAAVVILFALAEVFTILRGVFGGG